MVWKFLLLLALHPNCFSKKKLYEKYVYIIFYKKEITYACGSVPCLVYWLRAEYMTCDISVFWNTRPQFQKRSESTCADMKRWPEYILNWRKQVAIIFTSLFLVASGLTCSMRYLSRAGMGPVSLTLACGFLSTVPPGTSPPFISNSTAPWEGEGETPKEAIFNFKQ